MGNGKWGESFLKSGLPLEYLTHVTFRELDWDCRPSVEFVRPDKCGEEQWFELDLEATSPKTNGGTELAFLVECKYHDLSRYWMFLPHQSHGRWQFDDRVFNCGPLQTLKHPRSSTILDLAPMSSKGIVVGEDGRKQDNAIHTAVQQVANGFVPVVLARAYGYNLDFHEVAADGDEQVFIPNATALIPAIVTNARIFRLRPDIRDIDRIRQACEPSSIADELPWTWCYHDAPLSLIERNEKAIQAHKNATADLVNRFPGVDDRMRMFRDRPNWVAVINIRYLREAVTMIERRFVALATVPVRSVVRAPARRARRRLPDTRIEPTRG